MANIDRPWRITIRATADNGVMLTGALINASVDAYGDETGAWWDIQFAIGTPSITFYGSEGWEEAS